MNVNSTPTMMLIGLGETVTIAMPWPDGEKVLPLLRAALAGTITVNSKKELGLIAWEPLRLSIGAAGFDNVHTAYDSGQAAPLSLIRGCDQLPLGAAS